MPRLRGPGPQSGKNLSFYYLRSPGNAAIGRTTCFGNIEDQMTTSSDDRAGIEAAAQAWIDAFNEHDSAKISALYDDGAVLWGTLAPEIILSSEGVQAYFERTFQMAPPPTVELGAQHARLFGDVAVSSGSYRLSFVIGGQLQAVPARFSFTYRRASGQWLIVDHHSSLLPSAYPDLLAAQ